MGLKSAVRRGLKASGIVPRWHYLFKPYRPLPTDRQTVNCEYSSGHWESLKSTGELPRFHIIAGYCEYLKPNGAILDVGCGEGILQQTLRSYSYYLGIDLSDEAIHRASFRQSEQTHFAQADATTYHPDRMYDIVVFNECLFYLKNPAETVVRYSNYLASNGTIIVSMYEMGLDRSIWKMLESLNSVVASIRIQNTERVTWNIKLLKTHLRS